jgi:D-aspartate ligase
MDENNKPLGALVIASSYTALGIIRSLGRHKIPVWVIGDRFSINGVSRYARRVFPIQGTSEEEQALFLIELAKQHNLKGWAIFPDSDKSVGMIAHHYEALAKYYKLTSPTWDVVEWAFDKHLTYQLAEELNLAYPKTFYPHNRADVDALEGVFPMILKPANHQGNDRFSIISGAWQANNRAELLSLYDRANAAADESVIVIQEMIPGGGEAQFSYAALCKNGHVLARVFAQRKRLLPVDFGSSSYVETIINTPEIEEPAQRWLEKIKYTGIVEVEFKFDSRVNRYKLLDVNARAWGWHVLCRYAGVDFPYLMWKLVNDEEIPPTHAPAGVRWLRTAYDLMSALQSIQRGSLSWGDYLNSLKGAHHDIYTLDDLMPAIAEIPLLFKLVWNKLQGN